MHLRSHRRRHAKQATSPQPPRRDFLARNPRFGRFWLARTISMTGTAMSAVALPIMIFDLTGSSLATSLVTAAEVAPYVVTGAFIGALADRWSARVMAVTADTVAALAMALPLAAWLLGHGSPTVLLAVAFGVAACAVWFDAASWRYLLTLVDADDKTVANTAISASSTTALLVGPTLSGIVMGTAGGIAVLSINATTFAVSAALVGSITIRHARPADTLTPSVLTRLIKDGAVFLLTERRLRLLTGIGFFQSFAHGVVLALIVVFGARELHLTLGGWHMGVLFSSIAIGGLIGTATYPLLAGKTPGTRLTIVVLPVGALTIACISQSTHWACAAAAAAAWTACYTLVALNGVTVRQLTTPPELQSRVGTLGRLVSWGGQPFGAIFAGLAASHTAAAVPLVVAAACLLVVATLAGTPWDTLTRVAQHATRSRRTHNRRRLPGDGTLTRVL